MVSAKSMSSGGVSNYHKKDSYHKEIDGEWGGKLADKLELHGKIDNKDFKQIVGKDKKNAGSDFTFSMPKSASIAMYLSPELKEIIMEAHEKSVNKTLNYMEKNLLEYRTKKGGVIEIHDTDKMLYSKFDHLYSRDLDPQAHTHVFIHNRVYDGNGKKYALDARKLYRSKHLLGHIYRNEMNKLLQEKGIKTIVTDKEKGFYEVDGITKKQRDLFSKRRNTIVAEIKKRGWNIKNLKVTSQISLETRKVKAKINEIGMEQLVRNWRESFAKSDIKLENLTTIKGFKKLDTESINNLFNDETSEIFKKTLAISEVHYKKMLLKSGLEYGVTIDDVDSYLQTKSKELIQTKINHQNYYTSFEAYDLEKRVLAFIENGTNKGFGLSEITKQSFLNSIDKLGFTKGQKEAFIGVLGTKDVYSAIQGYAGVGKTYMLNYVRQAYEKGGWKVRGMAFQGKAAKELTIGAKIKSNTIHSFLKNYKPTGNKELWVVDESSTIDNNLLHKLQMKVEEAEDGKIKVVFVGDKKQLQPIGVGNAFTQALEGNKFKDVSYMEEILRQKNDTLRNAVYEVIKGNTEKAMQLLDKNIYEHSDINQRHGKIVDKYLELNKQKQNTLVLTGLNFDRININYLIHNKRYKTGLNRLASTIGRDFDVNDKLFFERTIRINPNEKIIFLKNNRGIDVKNGTLATVKSINKDQIVAIDDATGSKIRFNPQKYKDFDYGYCVTTHKSQGATVDRTILNINTKQKGINSLNKLYVDLSRAKYGTDIFVDNKSELVDSFQKWQEKISIKDFGVDEKVLYQYLGVEKVKSDDVNVSGRKDYWFELRKKSNKNYYVGKYNFDGTYDLYKDYIPKDCPFSQVEYKMCLNKLSEKEKITMLKKDIVNLSMPKINKINERSDMRAILNENKILQKKYGNIDLTHKQLKIIDKYAPKEIQEKLKNIGVTKEVKEWMEKSIPKYKNSFAENFYKDIKDANEKIEITQSFKMSM